MILKIALSKTDFFSQPKSTWSAFNLIPFFRKLVPTSEMSELVASKMSVAQLRKILTQRGKMKMTDEEVDELIKRVSPESLDRWNK